MIRPQSRATIRLVSWGRFDRLYLKLFVALCWAVPVTLALLPPSPVARPMRGGPATVIESPASQPPAAPGDYRLSLQMVQEGVAWFPCALHGNCLDLEVRVR